MTKPFNVCNEDTNQIRYFHLAKDKWHFYYEFCGFLLDEKNCVEHQGVLWAHNKISTSKNTETTNKNQMSARLSLCMTMMLCCLWHMTSPCYISILFYCNQNNKKKNKIII